MGKHLWVIAFILVVVVVILAVLIMRRRPHAGMPGVPGVLGGAEGDAYEEGFVDGGGISIRMREPWFQAVLDGKKTVDARLDRPPFSKLKAGSPVVIARSRPQGDTTEYPGPRRVKATVRGSKKYAGLAELLDGESLADVAPGAKTKAAALKSFREFITEDAEKESGVLAISFDVAKQ